MRFIVGKYLSYSGFNGAFYDILLETGPNSYITSASQLTNLIRKIPKLAIIKGIEYPLQIMEK